MMGGFKQKAEGSSWRRREVCTSAVPMRTPPGLSVVSERPWMTPPPHSPAEPVSSTKSPWYHTPGRPAGSGGAR